MATPLGIEIISETTFESFLLKKLYKILKSRPLEYVKQSYVSLGSFDHFVYPKLNGQTSIFFAL